MADEEVSTNSTLMPVLANGTLIMRQDGCILLMAEMSEILQLICKMSLSREVLSIRINLSVNGFEYISPECTVSSWL